MTLLYNPWHHAGAVIARLAVTGATFIWSAVGLYNDGMLLPPPSVGPMMLRYGPDKTWGWFFLTLSAIMFYRVARHSKPHKIGAIAYAVLLVAWLYVDVMLWFFIRPMYPVALGWVTVGTALAIYAFVANPRTPSVAHG